MVAAGIIYVPGRDERRAGGPGGPPWPRRRAALLEVIRAGVLPVEVGVMVIIFMLDRHDRHHQHHARGAGDLVPDPLRDGPGEHLPPDVPDPAPGPPQSVGGADLPGHRRGGASYPRDGAHAGRPRAGHRRHAGQRDRGLPAVHLRAGDHLRAENARREEERHDVYKANTPLLYVGILGNAILLAYVIIDRPQPRCAGSLDCWPLGSCSSWPKPWARRSTVPSVGLPDAMSDCLEKEL